MLSISATALIIFGIESGFGVPCPVESKSLKVEKKFSTC